MKPIVTEAIVLRRINYQEADRILTILTMDQGKLTVIAKGARRAKSKLAGSIELFGTSQITYLPGKGDISLLISARLINNYGNIVKDFNRTQLGYEILKLINKNIEVIGDAAIYQLLALTLEYLNDESLNADLTKFWFSLRFLILMGHSPNLNTQSQNTEPFSFSIDSMSFIEDKNGIFGRDHIKLLRLATNNNPKQLSKITNINKLLDNNLNLTYTMLVGTGFNPI